MPERYLVLKVRVCGINEAKRRRAAPLSIVWHSAGQSAVFCNFLSFHVAPGIKPAVCVN